MPIDIPSDNSIDAPDLEVGRKLFAGDCQFFWAAPTLETLPPADLPEVAFAGRSNVGKSSLINGLTGRNDIARASNTPGRTRELIFFNLATRLWLVDMPGYGHAEAAKTEIARWTKLIDAYLKGRQTLRRLCLLVDARHGLKVTDTDMMTQLDKAAVVYQIVLTKADKVKPTELVRIQTGVEKALAKRPAAHPRVIATSSETGMGMPELRAELGALAREAPPPVKAS